MKIDLKTVATVIGCVAGIIGIVNDICEIKTKEQHRQNICEIKNILQRIEQRQIKSS